jgi:two-component system chemotaxis response regulator CheY
MSKPNIDSAEDYPAGCDEHLATIETDLLAIGKGGSQTDEDRVERVISALRSVEEGADAFELATIRELAHGTEEVVALIRFCQMVPTADQVRVLLRATDKLHDLAQSPETSGQADIAEIMDALAGLRAAHRAKGAPSGKTARMLLVEDDFASRLLLQKFLSRYGECHVAVNGKEAVAAFRAALERGLRYDLICMDIMMPEMDGREAVRQVRAIEQAQGITSTFGAKIVMTTALDDIKEVSRCFDELCDAYLVKPIDLGKLLACMKSYRLVA